MCNQQNQENSRQCKTIARKVLRSNQLVFKDVCCHRLNRDIQNRRIWVEKADFKWGYNMRLTRIEPLGAIAEKLWLKVAKRESTRVCQ